MRTEKVFRVTSSGNRQVNFNKGLKFNHLRYQLISGKVYDGIDYCTLFYKFVISNDMITEVEELLHEIAVKTGVRIE